MTRKYNHLHRISSRLRTATPSNSHIQTPLQPYYISRHNSPPQPFCKTFSRRFTHRTNSTKSKSPSTSSSPSSNPKSTPTPTDPQAEAIQKAKQLHSELQILLANQAKREAEHANQPWGTYLKQLIKTSRSELINIGAAFLCLVLALQIAGNRRVSKQIVLESDGLTLEVQERDRRLRLLRQRMINGENEEEDETFVGRICANCVDALLSNDSRKERTHSTWKSWFVSQTNTDDSITPPKNNQQRQELIQILKPIIYQELQATLGTYGLSDDEKTMHELELLQSMKHEDSKLTAMNATATDSSSNSSTVTKIKLQEEGLDTLLGELQKASSLSTLKDSSYQDIKNGNDGEKRVTKAKFVM